MTTGREFEGRRVIVTGAAAGIGRAIALRFARAGARVGCLDVNEKALDSVVAEIGAFAGAGGTAGAVALLADVSSEAATKRAVDEAVAAMGGLDVVVNNAGIVSGFEATLRVLQAENILELPCAKHQLVDHHTNERVSWLKFIGWWRAAIIVT